VTAPPRNRLWSRRHKRGLEASRQSVGSRRGYRVSSAGEAAMIKTWVFNDASQAHGSSNPYPEKGRIGNLLPKGTVQKKERIR